MPGFDLGVLLAVSLRLLVVLAPAQLEDLHLLAAAVRHHGRCHRGARRRAARRPYRFALADQQHLFEDDFGADLGGQLLDPHLSPVDTRYCLPPVLMTAYMWLPYRSLRAACYAEFGKSPGNLELYRSPLKRIKDRLCYPVWARFARSPARLSASLDPIHALIADDMARGRRADPPPPGFRCRAGAAGGGVHRRERRQAAAPGAGAPGGRRVRLSRRRSTTSSPRWWSSSIPRRCCMTTWSTSPSCAAAARPPTRRSATPPRCWSATSSTRARSR